MLLITQQEQGHSVHSNVTESEKLIKTKNVLLLSFPRVIKRLPSNMKTASVLELQLHKHNRIFHFWLKSYMFTNLNKISFMVMLHCKHSINQRSRSYICLLLVCCCTFYWNHSFIRISSSCCPPRHNLLLSWKHQLKWWCQNDGCPGKDIYSDNGHCW